uniref:Peroxidase n=1 Tax=Aegilops tauschii subsp. strangulata TaxID=200361 RepID=A0A453AYK3_AEGTS
MANLAVAILFASLGAVATAQKASAPAAEMPAYQGSYPSYASPPVAEMPAYQGSYPSHISSPAASPSYTFPAATPAPSQPSMAAPTASPPSPTPSPSPGRRRRLRVGFYRRSCPRAEKIVREAVRNATSKNPGLGAGIIRMHFHDCFVQGCDASVLLDPTAANPQPEKLSPPNFPSLRGFEVIDAAKEALEKVCPGRVSCADIIAFAARDASFFLSRARINFRMPAGRLDGRVSLSSEALDFLPPPFFNLSQLVDNFKAKNLDEDDLVVLSGAHTIGVSHCSSFTDRLPPNPSDMNPAFATLLQSKCPVSPNFTNDPTVVQDIVTPNRLDTRYYTNVLKRNVLFTSDAALLSSWRTARKVVENALIPRRWESKFARAMVKMAAIELKTAANGEIRKMCRVVNN